MADQWLFKSEGGGKRHTVWFGPRRIKAHRMAGRMRLAFVWLLLSLLFVSSSAHAQATACAVDTIPRAELATEMRTATLSHGEYDLLATPNWPRFLSTLYLQLARRAMEREPLGGVLYIPPDYLFWEFLSLAGVVDPSEAPGLLLWALHLDQGTQL